MKRGTKAKRLKIKTDMEIRKRDSDQFSKWRPMTARIVNIIDLTV